MLYMIVEDFRNDAPAVYRRFRNEGRLMPDGLTYVSSWVTADYQRCFQVMQCDDRALLEQWMKNWSDLMNFEVIHVIPSAEAAAAMAAKK
jgi:hypothetical protein